MVYLSLDMVISGSSPGAYPLEFRLSTSEKVMDCRVCPLWRIAALV